MAQVIGFCSPRVRPGLSSWLGSCGHLGRKPVHGSSVSLSVSLPLKINKSMESQKQIKKFKTLKKTLNSQRAARGL